MTDTDLPTLLRARAEVSGGDPLLHEAAELIEGLRWECRALRDNLADHARELERLRRGR